MNAVNPGIIDTPLNRRAFQSDADYADYLARSSDLHPVRRCGEADDVAHLILFLADSNASGFITGQIHVIDGGRSLPAPSLQFKEDSRDHEMAEQPPAPAIAAASPPSVPTSALFAAAVTPSPAPAAPLRLTGVVDGGTKAGTPYAERSLVDRRILITGGARGIGAAVASALARRRAVVLIADRLEQDLEAMRAVLAKSGACYAFAYDQTSSTSVKGLFERIRAAVGGLDGLVACAGVMNGIGIDATECDDGLERVNWRVNAEGCECVVRHALPLLLALPSAPSPVFEPTVVFVGSSSARLEHPDAGYGALAYRGSRAAINGLMVATAQLYCTNDATAVGMRKGTLGRVASGDPGYVASALGVGDPRTRGLPAPVSADELIAYKKRDGALSPEEGADTLVWLICAASIPASGKMYYQREIVPF